MSIKTTCGLFVVCCIAQTLSMVLPGGGGMYGGYGGCAETITSEHIAAANFALSSNGIGITLDSILCVKEQIVDGINYDMKLRVNVGHTCKETCDIVVYRGPFSQQPMPMSVSSKTCTSTCAGQL
ncbi:uncharacterized protein LOC132720234 [Ruditapes philippinarum]|uniref:uncharacterized protein LOC132720234 n=1 Tax=Ruditapes philippinarum TaxID=129788 RepID=UPI00295BB75A|nr:uncharacterized protein LOC132720234 [Ruditapes philippinarum]XP_060560309.1 uncharacterized protein LOC132720234 [Ruditapes philippinarum]